MTEELKWQPTCERYVAFLDIMGFKDRLQRDGHEKVHNLLQTIRTYVKMIDPKSKCTNIKTVPRYSLPVMFSDSIILISKDDTNGSAGEIFHDASHIIDWAIVSKIPIKGAIAYGKLTAEMNEKFPLYFGQPLVDAFELQKELHLYGVVLHHSIQQRLTDLDVMRVYEDEDKTLVNYAVPMKSGNINHYTINWTSTLDKNENPEELVSQLYNSVSGKPRIYVDNTLEFVRRVTEKKAEKEKKK